VIPNEEKISEVKKKINEENKPSNKTEETIKKKIKLKLKLNLSLPKVYLSQSLHLRTEKMKNSRPNPQITRCCKGYRIKVML
jgi:hypothetical protein